MDKIDYNCYFDCYSILSLFPPSLWRVSYIIYLPLGHLNPTLVDYLSPHLSARPTRRPIWLSVSCGS